MLKYVDKDGKRYATDPHYEDSLTNMYQTYISNGSLMEKYLIYNKYKILTGK